MSNCSAYNGPVCFGKGDCLLSNVTGTWQCVWRSDELGYADSWLYVIFSVLLILLALLYLLEILLDFSRYGFCRSQLSGSISLWKNPILFCKLFGFSACIFRAVFFIMSAHEAVANYNFGRWQKTFMEVVALLALALTYGFHSIVWISTILKAKSLGGTNLHIRRYRIVVYIVMLSAPVFFFLAMFNVFIPGEHENTRELLSLGGLSIQALYLLTLLIGNSIFVYQVLRWALKMFEGNTKNRAVKGAIRRTTALLVCNVCFALLFACEILDFLLDENSKPVQYSFFRLVFADFLQIVILSTFFLISEGYFSVARFPLGYIESFNTIATLSATKSHSATSRDKFSIGSTAATGRALPSDPSHSAHSFSSQDTNSLSVTVGGSGEGSVLAVEDGIAKSSGVSTQSEQ